MILANLITILVTLLRIQGENGLNKQEQMMLYKRATHYVERHFPVKFKITQNIVKRKPKYDQDLFGSINDLEFYSWIEITRLYYQLGILKGDPSKSFNLALLPPYKDTKGTYWIGGTAYVCPWKWQSTRPQRFPFAYANGERYNKLRQLRLKVSKWILIHEITHNLGSFHDTSEPATIMHPWFHVRFIRRIDGKQNEPFVRTFSNQTYQQVQKCLETSFQ